MFLTRFKLATGTNAIIFDFPGDLAFPVLPINAITAPLVSVQFLSSSLSVLDTDCLAAVTSRFL